MSYLHLHEGIEYSYYLRRWKIFDDDLFVERTGWRPFKALSPAESPKSVLTHEHVTCTLDARGDAPQITSKEIRPTTRYARQTEDASEDPKPHAPGRDPARENGGYGLP